MEINTFNEGPLHAALKQRYAGRGAHLEVEIDGYVIDVVQDGLLIEIQTGGFSSLKKKLTALLQSHAVRLVYPIAHEKWIVKLGDGGSGERSRRKSPKRGRLEHIFYELVSIPHLLAHPNFSLEVLLIQEEEHRRYDPHLRRGRGRWATEQRLLLSVLERHLFDSPADLALLLPPSLGDPFTTADLAQALERRRQVAQKMAYCLRRLDVVTAVGKEGNAILYQRSAPRPS
ncbi:MAG: hypothetical protein R3272_00365 [Candidatus Promineifilaceae bacterium]|nr:hypothetical protein [Candidatus Promineifilaceae bacterium]